MITRIIRPIQGRIEVRGLPKNRDPAVPNRQWFKDSLQKHIRPNWVSYSSGYGHWEIARSHLQPVVEAIVRREGEVLLELHCRTNEKCDTRYQNARGFECVCSCLGREHGGGEGRRWIPVGDTTLIHLGDETVEQILLTYDDLFPRG